MAETNYSRPVCAASAQLETTHSDTISRDAFFTTPDGLPTIVTGGDFRAALPNKSEQSLVEMARYWAVYPYSYVSICRDTQSNEVRYIVVEPYLSQHEADLINYLIDRVKHSLRNDTETQVSSKSDSQRTDIRRRVFNILSRYDLFDTEPLRVAHKQHYPELDSASRSVPARILRRGKSLVGSEDEPYNPPEFEYSGENALAYGATDPTPYLPVIDKIGGHPAYQLETNDDSKSSENVSVEFAAPAFTLRGNNKTATVTVVTREQVDSVSVYVNDNKETVLSEEDFNRVSTSNNRFVYQAMYTAPESGTYEFELTTLNTKTGQSYIAEKSGALSKFEWKFTDAQGTKDVTLTDGGTKATGEPSPSNSNTAEKKDAPTIEESRTDKRGLTVTDVKQAALSPEDETITLYQAYKLLYYIEREIVGYGLIDPIKNDQQIEDISCNGYNEPVFVYHTDHKQIRSNLVHGQEELDRFVKSLAQYAGKEVSRRSPQADAKIPDGSRAQLTLGDEVSEGGTNYTIRQFKDVPFTPVDLLNWETYSLDELAYLWLCAEHGMSILVAGGTGAGKTTTLNAISLFIPAQSKLVSIEDTQEIKLPHRNWTKELTREAGDQMDRRTSIDEYDLLESALRMRPDRIIMSEVRGEEGEELFQGMSSGHPGLTTFHADSVDKSIYRMTSEPISVEPAMFVSLDLICVQTETQVEGNTVRRSTEVSEIGGMGNNEGSIERNKYFERNAKKDAITKQGDSWNINKIQKMNGWSDEQLIRELDRRKAVLAYLSVNQITQYREVASTIQAFIQDQETVLQAMRTHTLTDRIEGFRSLGNIQIKAGEEAEKSVSRPSPSAELQQSLERTLESDLVRVLADVN